ncbi:MAG: hypothetical protein JXA66_08135 [Oligoflexia bacterium]|nr:hypothetical protein [Oligoflexia bacterium]
MSILWNNLRISGKELTYQEAVDVIKKLGEQFGGSSLFGKEKDKSFESSIKTIYQSFGGQELYLLMETGYLRCLIRF